MKDFRGVELAIGDIVAWTAGKSAMHLGKIVDFTAQKAYVKSILKDGREYDKEYDPVLVDVLRIAKL